MMQTVLSNAQHPEYGQVTIPFPLAQDQYDDCIEMLEKLGIGDTVQRDCRVDEIRSQVPILKRLEKIAINVDELDYLAKRLDSFTDQEMAQFQGMAVKTGIFDMTDFINLTFCCQQATVITDFSDLDQVGLAHYLTMEGGGAPLSDVEKINGREVAMALINYEQGTITPFGVVYDNGMKLEQLYDGRHLPGYHYTEDMLAVGISSREEPENTSKITWLYLPCTRLQVERGMERSGIATPEEMRLWYEDSSLPPEVENVLEFRQESIYELNDLASAIEKLSPADRKKLGAAVEMAKPEYAFQIRHLAENLDQFEFAPNVHTPAEYGRYMIQESGHFEYDENLEGFYDYEKYKSMAGTIQRQRSDHLPSGGRRYRLKSFIPWVGGKGKLLWILNKLAPERYNRFIDVFGGSGTVTMNRPIQPGCMEVYNDFNGNLTNLFCCVKNRPMALLRELGFLPLNTRDDFNVLYKFFSRDEFTDDYLREEMELTEILLKPPDAEAIRTLMLERATRGDIRRAADYFKMIRYSFSGSAKSFGGKPCDIRRFFHLIWECSRRLANVVIENKDFEDLICQYDRDDAFIYCDPPYFEAECYEVGFPKENHQRLHDVLLNCQG